MPEPAAKEETISPSPEQHAVINQVVDWYGQKKGAQEFYLAGYAGVGKSTIANLAIRELREKKKGVKDVRTAAYTGKAASVLRKKGIENAQTIHSLIYHPVEDKETGEVRFVLDEGSDAASADLIVLDECSMVGEEMANDLRSFKKKILVLGDPAQLPPLNGQGAFTNREPDAFLREIHRQAADSPILELATLARQGQPLPGNYQKGNVRIVPLTKETQSLIYEKDTQPICGLNRVRWTYNRRIRTLRGFSGETPQVGERLICCRNNRKAALFNGGMGVLQAIRLEKPTVPGTFEIDVKMDDLEKPSLKLIIDPYLFRNHFSGGASKRMDYVKGRPSLNEFDWGYILTGHKAQGSGWPHVTIIDDSAAFRDNRKNWLYTCLTRAETGLTLLTRQ